MDKLEVGVQGCTRSTDEWSSFPHVRRAANQHRSVAEGDKLRGGGGEAGGGCVVGTTNWRGGVRRKCKCVHNVYFLENQRI